MFQPPYNATVPRDRVFKHSILHNAYHMTSKVGVGGWVALVDIGRFLK